MSYVPDKLGERRRKENVSQTACEVFIQYCEHADKETGLTFANPKTIADAWEMRSDNAQKYDKELQDKGWIVLVENDGKIIRKVCAGWIPRSQRGQGKAENTNYLNFRKGLDELLNFRKSSYILGELPKFKEKLLNFRNAYKEYIDQPINQLLDQLLDQTETENKFPSDVPDTNSGLPDSDEGKPEGKRGRKTERLEKLNPDFSISAEMRTWAANKAKDVDVDGELEEFVSFWCDIATKNNRRTKRGWVATWQKRMADLQEKIDEQKKRLELWQGRNGERNGHQTGNSSTTKRTDKSANGNGESSPSFIARINANPKL